jgi:hypothetical protein
LVVALPAVATLRDYSRRDRPTWSLGESLGAVAGLVMALGWLIRVLTLVVANGQNAFLEIAIGFGPPQYLDLGTCAAAFVLAWIVVRHNGTAWNHWLNAEPDRAGSPRVPPERSPSMATDEPIASVNDLS